MQKGMAASAADLLFKNYISLAQDYTDAAEPQDNVAAVIASDWRYKRALQGIRLLAQQHVGQLVQSLIAWRQAVNEDIKRNFSTNNVVNVQGVCKRAAMEVLFLEAALQVLDEFVPEFWQDQHFQNFFKSMLNVAFRWLLNAEEYVPHQELTAMRASVVQLSSSIIGAMSSIRLSDVTVVLVQKLEERVGTRTAGPTAKADANLLRTQALKLCTGMHSLILSFDTDSQLEQSTNFLKLVHPLHFTAAVKKSQVHHALCEMLTNVLAPLIRSNQPQSCPGLSPALLKDWYSNVLTLKNEVGQWVNQHSKHTNVGYPLVTVLVCLVDADNYKRQVESMADFLVKQMKVKEYRVLCFKCLEFLVTSTLVRNKAAASNPQVVAWLDKVVKAVLANARKGGISAQEQQGFVTSIADLSPEYCVGNVILDLLQSDSAESQLIALRSLHQVATSVPQAVAAALGAQAGSLRKSGTALLTSSNGGAPSSMPGAKHLAQLPASAVLELIRSGQHPFELQGIAQLLPRVQHQVGLLLTQCHRSAGSFLLFTSEAVPKDKQSHLELFRLVLGLLPFLRPEQWISPRPLDYLPPYTAHADSAVRLCARGALVRIVQGCPVLRGPVLASLAAFLAAIPDEAVQVIRECLLLLRELMEVWLSLLQEQRLSSSLIQPGTAAGSSRLQPSSQHLPSSSSQDNNPSGAAAAVQFGVGAAGPEDPACFALDLHRLEGVLFMLLCSVDESIRFDAYSALGLLRTLHQHLYIMAEELGVQPGMATQLPVQQQQQHLLQQQQPPASPSVAAAGTTGGSFSSVSTLTASVLGAVAGVDGSFAAAGASTPPASSAASGSGMFFRHKPSVSRDSWEFMQALVPIETPDDEVLCLMDVLEEVGDDVARRCYWDFGDWSDLWRETKHAPTGANLQAVMRDSDEVGTLRWIRCIVDLVKAASHMCPTSMGVAYLEMLHKLSRYLSRDAAGRLTIPTDTADGRRSEAWRAMVAAVCVCPPSLRDRVEAAARKGSSSFSARDLIRAVVASLTSCSAVPQQVCLMALGHCSHEHYPVLFEELPSLIEEYTRTKRRGTAARPEEARKSVANVLRLLADAMPPGTLTTQLVIRARYLDWIRDTAFFLRQLPRFGEAFWEVSQVAYCLCAICRCVAGELVAPMSLPINLMRDAAPVQRANSNKGSLSEPLTPAGSMTSAQGLGHRLSPIPPPTGQEGLGAVGGGSGTAAGQAPVARKLMFEMFAAWCEEGDGGYKQSLREGINTALASIRDFESEVREGLSQELVQAAELLDQAARLAMAALLQGPVFDTDARRAQGPVLRWIDRLLKAQQLGISQGAVPAVPKDAVGRAALLNLLRSNPEMFTVCVDRCYERDGRIAAASFQVVSEVYSLQAVKVEPHVVLSLVLYKMVDANLEIREDALHMLQILSLREWQTAAADLTSAAAAAAGTAKKQQDALALEAEGDPGSVLVLGALQDSYQQFQYELAVSLARDHPELSEALCEEMMTRQLELADKVSQHPVLTCLSPWMENLTIAAHWKGTWCERLLKSMYYVTLRHGDELPVEIERLWRTLAHNRRNIIPMLDFLATLGTHMAYQQELPAMLEYLGVSKRICLYLARQNAQQTIDHLVYEVSLQLLEDEGPTPNGSSNGSQGQQLRSVPPLEFSIVLQQGMGMAASQRSTAEHREASWDAADHGLAATPSTLRSSFGTWWAHNVAGSGATTPAAQAQPSAFGPGSAAAGAGSASVSSSSQLQAGLAASLDQQQQQGLPMSSSLGSNLGMLHDSAAAAGAAQLARDNSSSLTELRDSSQGTGLVGAGSLSQHGPRRTSEKGHNASEGSSFSSATASGQVTGNSTAGPEQLSGAAAAAVAGSSSSLGGPAGLPAASAMGVSTDFVLEGGAGGVGASGSAVGAGQGPGVLARWNPGSTLAPSSSAADHSSAARASSIAGLDLAAYYASKPVQTGLAGAGRGCGGAPVLREEGGWMSSPGGVMHNSPRPTREPQSPALRGLVTRPELALCLLAEVVYEHDEDVSSHLALLCHVCLLLADYDEHVVAAAAQQLLINCLYSLSHHARGLMQEEHKQLDTTQAAALIKYVQSMRGRCLWPAEDISLDTQQQLPSSAALSNMVQHCLEAFSFSPGLQQAWVSVSLDWALHARCRHLSSRSQQVLRALQPQLTADMCSILLLCLQQCFAAAEGSAVARDVALELLLTLRELLGALPPRKLLLYPQVFWASLSLLFTSYVSLYKQGLLLLTACLQQLPLHDSTVQNILLAAAPSGDPDKLQKLLSSCQAGSTSSYANTSSSSKGPAASTTLGGAANRYATAPAGFGSPAAAAAAAAAAARAPAGGPTKSSRPYSSVSGQLGQGVDVGSSYVGGVKLPGGSPMLWPFGQLLPWPERGPDGPSHYVLALQQLLFKGLLLPETQLEAVQLFTLLAGGLCQLPPSAPQPIQAPTARQGFDAAATGSASRDGRRDQKLSSGGGLRGSLQGQLHGGRGSEGGSSSGGSRGTSRASPATPSDRKSPPAAAADAAMRASAGAGPGGKPQQQQGQQGQQQAGGDAAAVCRSAPEFRGLRGSSRASRGSSMGGPGDMTQQQQQQQQLGLSAATTANQLQSSCSMWTSLMRGASCSSGVADGSRRLPGTRAAFQVILGQRHAQLLVSIASIVPFFCSQLGKLEPDSQLLQELQECMHALAAACHSHGMGALGSSVMQFAAALNVNCEGSSATAAPFGGSSDSRQASMGPHQQRQQRGMQGWLQQEAGYSLALQQGQSPLRPSAGPAGNLCVSGSGSTRGYAGGQAHPHLGPPSPGLASALQQLMQPLCVQLSQSLLPTFAEWLLRFWMGLLLLPGASAVHPHVLLLLRCLFDTPGLQLGPDAAALLLDSTFLSPLVALAQSPLCQYALDALDSIMTFASSCPDLQQQQQGGPIGSSSSLAALSSSMGQQPLGAGGPAVDLHSLAACVLPQLDCVELLQRVLESFGTPPLPRKKKQRLLPFLVDSGGSSTGHTHTDRVVDM